MSDELDTKSGVVVDHGCGTAFIEASITRLKGRLEEKLALHPGRENWEDMVADCDIILKHLESSDK